MNDNIITKDEAIDRMKAGLPCESKSGERWFPTRWSDFDSAYYQFRKPPEPRRVAREWWICDDGYAVSKRPLLNLPVHVREVLPGDVTLQRMTRNQFREKTKSLGLVAQDHEAVFHFARALGLIADKSALGEGS